MKFVGIVNIVLLLFLARAEADSGVDPKYHHAWGENIGWTNWDPTLTEPNSIVVGPSYLGGFIWSENTGWINLGDGSPANDLHYDNMQSDDFGVNIDSLTGDLFGLAWGENIGWINFDTSTLEQERARYSTCDRRFFGFAWSENTGWINLDHAVHFVAVGPCIVGDIDCDGAISLADWAGFVSYLSGPNIASACQAFDADDDDDIDLLDYADLQRSFMPED